MTIRSKKEALQDALADPFDPRPPSEKAKELGVAERTFRQWAGERKWWDEIYAKLQLRLEASLPRVVGALINKAVDKGDVPAAKLLLQIAGKLSDEDAPSGPDVYREILLSCLGEGSA